jgi:hypothetical protein
LKDAIEQVSVVISVHFLDGIFIEQRKNGVRFVAPPEWWN